MNNNTTANTTTTDCKDCSPSYGPCTSCSYQTPTDFYNTAATATTHSHTSLGTTTDGRIQRTGLTADGDPTLRQTCVRCGSALARVYPARDNATGTVEAFGPNCHYAVTGIDTRLIDTQIRDDRAKRNAAEYAATEAAANAAYVEALAQAPNGWLPDHVKETTALFDLDGNFLTANERSTRYGYAWFSDAIGFVSTSTAQKPETRIRNNAKKGVYEGRILVESAIGRNGEYVLTDDEWQPERIVAILDNGQAPELIERTGPDGNPYHTDIDAVDWDALEAIQVPLRQGRAAAAKAAYAARSAVWKSR